MHGYFSAHHSRKQLKAATKSSVFPLCDLLLIQQALYDFTSPRRSGFLRSSYTPFFSKQTSPSPFLSESATNLEPRLQILRTACQRRRCLFSKPTRKQASSHKLLQSLHTATNSTRKSAGAGVHPLL